MRGGTSRGLYFWNNDLPKNSAERDEILLQILGAGEKRGITGLGSIDPLLTKIAIVSASNHINCDLDYVFLQGNCEKSIIDASGNCGNIVAAVGQFALEYGILSIQKTINHTTVKIHNINTGKDIESSFPVMNGLPFYEGETHIHGVNHTGASVALNFIEPSAAITSHLFPTGNLSDIFHGFSCTVIDCSTLVVIISAQELGLIGNETPDLLDKTPGLLEKITAIRQEVCNKLYLPSAETGVLPKVCIISPPQNTGNFCSRFFTPFRCHAAHPLTGAIAVTASCLIKGTVGYDQAQPPASSFQRETYLTIEHPSGTLDINLTLEEQNGPPNILKAGFLRTARKVMTGSVYVY